MDVLGGRHLGAGYRQEHSRFVVNAAVTVARNVAKAFQVEYRSIWRTAVRCTSTTALNGALGIGVRKMGVCAKAVRAIVARPRKADTQEMQKENRTCVLHRMVQPEAQCES